MPAFSWVYHYTFCIQYWWQRIIFAWKYFFYLVSADALMEYTFCPSNRTHYLDNFLEFPKKDENVYRLSWDLDM